MMTSVFLIQGKTENKNTDMADTAKKNVRKARGTPSPTANRQITVTPAQYAWFQKQAEENYRNVGQQTRMIIDKLIAESTPNEPAPAAESVPS